MKKSLLFLALVMATMVSAQDIIVRHDAQQIEAKIVEISNTELKYKRMSNLEGPTFVMPLSEVQTIMYSNGEVQNFDAPAQNQEQSLNNSAVAAQPEDDGKYHFEVQPEDNYFFGIMVGYASRQMVYKKPVEAKMSMAGELNGFSPSLQFGLMFQPTFKYGLGFRTGIITNYSRELFDQVTERGGTVEYEMHDITLGVPLDLAWRCKIYKKLSASIYTGPIIECGAWMVKQKKGSDPDDNLYSKKSPYTGKGGYWGINISWEIGASIQWDRLRLDVGGDFGLMNKAGEGADFRWNRPVYVALTCMF